MYRAKAVRWAARVVSDVSIAHRIVTIGLLLGLALNGPARADVERLSLERMIGPYTIRIYDIYGKATDWSPYEQALRILRDGQVLATVQNHRLRIEPFTGGEPAGYTTPPVGMNVTGGSEPNLIVYQYTGGAHCCDEVDVFEIGATVRKLGSISGNDAAVLFQDIDGDGTIEVMLKDSIFAYWRVSFSESPLIRVCERYDRQAGSFEFSSDLMRKLGPSPRDIPKVAEPLRASNDWVLSGKLTVTPELWATMLDYIYSGKMPA